MRDVERFPPGGIQPASPKALRSSWRGTAIGDTSAASVTIGPEIFGVDLDDLILRAVARRWSDKDIAGWDPALRALVVRARGDDEDARAARHQLRMLVDQADSADHGEEEVAETPEDRWWRGGFKGLAGIAELERVIDDFRARDVPELTEALLEQANLLARHGGRGDEVRARLDEAFSASFARAHATGEWEGFTGVVDQTWSWLQDRRDVDGQVSLARRCLDQAPECPWSEFDTPVIRLVGSVHDYRGREPRVGKRLAVAAATLLRERGDRDGAWAVEAALVWLLDTDGRVEEASAVCEAAWSQGCTQPDVLDRLSLRLERAKQFDRAAEVCRRALAAGAGSHTDTLAKREARCAIKAAKGARPEA